MKALRNVHGALRATGAFYEDGHIEHAGKMSAVVDRYPKCVSGYGWRGGSLAREERIQCPSRADFHRRASGLLGWKFVSHPGRWVGRRDPGAQAVDVRSHRLRLSRWHWPT